MIVREGFVYNKGRRYSMVPIAFLTFDEDVENKIYGYAAFPFRGLLDAKIVESLRVLDEEDQELRFFAETCCQFSDEVLQHLCPGLHQYIRRVVDVW